MKFNYPHKATQKLLDMEPKTYPERSFRRCRGCNRLKANNMFGKGMGYKNLCRTCIVEYNNYLREKNGYNNYLEYHRKWNKEKVKKQAKFEKRYTFSARRAMKKNNDSTQEEE